MQVSDINAATANTSADTAKAATTSTAAATATATGTATGTAATAATAATATAAATAAEQDRGGITRSRHIDLAAGILMLWIITFHAVNGSKVFGDVDARVVIPFLTFSMPWFFYKSGSFFRPGRGGNGMGRDIKKLLLPYLRWTVLGLAAYLLMMAVDGTFTVSECILKPLDTLWIYGYLPLDVPLWFVLTLFVVKMIAHFIFKTRVHPAAVAAFCFGIAFGLHIADNPGIPVWTANIPMGLAFFSLGYLLHEHEEKAWLFIPCIIGYILFIIFNTPVVGLHRNVHLAGNYYLWPLFSICGIIAFNNVCRLVTTALERLNAKRQKISGFHPLSFVGRHSLDLLVSHAFIYMPVLHYSKLTPIKTFILIETLYLVVLLPAIYLFESRLRRR